MTNIKNIVFDFGGVLVDWSREYLYDKIFTNPTEKDYFLSNVCTLEWNNMQDGGRPFSEAIAILQEKFPQYKKEISLFYDRWEEMLGEEIIDNTNIVKSLSGRYNLYGLTNWSGETIDIAYRKFDVFSHFKGIVVSGIEKKVKPGVEIFNILLNRYNLIASESVYIDDSMPNILTAKQLGFYTIHYNNESIVDKLYRIGIEI